MLDDERFRLTCGGRVVALRPKVFDLLVVLVRERERVVLREELVAKLWSSTAVGAGSLSGLVNELRAALGEDGRGPSSIRTVHARGYQFVAPVEGEGEREVEGRGGSEGERPAAVDPTLEWGDGDDGRGPQARVGPGSGVDRMVWERVLGEVRRAGPRALVAFLPEAAGRRAWLSRAVREAERAGFEVRWSFAGDERSDPSAAAALADPPAHRSPRSGRGTPIALALEVEDASAWSQAGGLARLLDLLGDAPVLVVAAAGDPSGALEGEWAGVGQGDPRVDVVAVGAASGEAAVAPGGFGGMREMLRVLARADGAGFVAALHAMGFEPARDAPIRSMRRVEPAGRGRGEGRDAEAV